MKAEDREDLDRYAVGELPPSRLEAVEKLLLLDGDARRYLVQLTQPTAPTKAKPRRRRKRVRRSSVKGRVLHASRLLIPSTVVVAGCLFAFAAHQLLPPPRRTTVLKIGGAASVPPGPVFHPPVVSGEVKLHDWANTIPRRPEYAANALLRRTKRLGSRPTVEEILALELANADTDSARKLEPLVLLHKQRGGGGSRIDGNSHPKPPPAAGGGSLNSHDAMADSSSRIEQGSKQ